MELTEAQEYMLPACPCCGAHGTLYTHSGGPSKGKFTISCAANDSNYLEDPEYPFNDWCPGECETWPCDSVEDACRIWRKEVCHER